MFPPIIKLNETAVLAQIATRGAERRSNSLDGQVEVIETVGKFRSCFIEHIAPQYAIRMCLYIYEKTRIHVIMLLIWKRAIFASVAGIGAKVKNKHYLYSNVCKLLLCRKIRADCTKCAMIWYYGFALGCEPLSSAQFLSRYDLLLGIQRSPYIIEKICNFFVNTWFPRYVHAG